MVRRLRGCHKLKSVGALFAHMVPLGMDRAFWDISLKCGGVSSAPRLLVGRCTCQISQAMCDKWDPVTIPTSFRRIAFPQRITRRQPRMPAVWSSIPLLCSASWPTSNAPSAPSTLEGTVTRRMLERSRAHRVACLVMSGVLRGDVRADPT